MRFVESTRLPIPFDCPLPNQILDIQDKVRANPLAWRGQFSPELVEALIRHYAPADACILDPFAGSGTVLFESASLGYEAHGTEINPAAATLARLARFANEPPKERGVIVERVERLLTDIAGIPGPLFRHKTDLRCTVDEVVTILLDARNNESKQFRWLVEALIIRLDLGNGTPDQTRLWGAWRSTRDIVLHLPYMSKAILIYLRDARRLPLNDGQIDFVLTSPPYINVFNYHHYYRRSVEKLGWKPLYVARSEVGSNRKFRQNRFLTVVQYCLDISLVLQELRRVCSPDSRLIFVIGRESFVQKTPFYIGQIVGQVAERTGTFRECLRQERVFQNRFGKNIYEDILHLVPLSAACRKGDEILVSAREVAVEVLEAARSRVPPDRLEWLERAIAEKGKIQPSPVFHNSEARNAADSPS